MKRRVILLSLLLLSAPPLHLFAAFFVKATREGLVGGITSNNHTIVTRDWFVALPSAKNLAKNFSWDQAYNGTAVPVRVRVTYGQRSIIAPVWDVGPWNTKDDYWNDNSVRSIYSQMSSYWSTHNAPLSPNLPPGWDPAVYKVPPSNALLSLGVPEAGEAYNTSQTFSQSSYNYGCDQFGRHRWYTAVPLNGAGIDLADGVAWDGLAIPGNVFVNWELTQDLPMIKQVVISNGSGVIYDSLTGVNSGAQAGLQLSVKIIFSETLNPNFTPAVSLANLTSYSASTGAWSITTYTNDTWTGSIAIPETAAAGTYTLNVDARDYGPNGGNKLDADESTSLYNPGIDSVHKISIVPVGANHIVISQFATRGATNANDEFVELYNPTSNSINIAGWKIQYMSATGTSWSTRDLLPSAASIPSLKHYLTANPTGYFVPASGQSPDAWWTSRSGISDNGHLRLVNSAGTEIDRVGYGTASTPEGGTPGAPNHGTTANSKSVGRNSDGKDSDINRNDFSVRSLRDPKNSSR